MQSYEIDCRASGVAGTFRALSKLLHVEMQQKVVGDNGAFTAHRLQGIPCAYAQHSDYLRKCDGSVKF